MRLIWWFSFIFFLPLLSCSKKQVENITIKEEFKAINFPEDWMGYWEGPLEIYNYKGLAQTIPMALDHQFTDTTGTFIWAIIYGEDKVKGRRNYFLKEIDKEKGHYVTDEKNGILLDSYLFKNKLVSTYEVMGTQISSIYTREKDYLTFEIIAGKGNIPMISGDTIINNDTIPEVISYPVTGYQKAVLRKKNALSN